MALPVARLAAMAARGSMIVETYQLAASDTDVLAAPSRLASIPYAGLLTLEFQSDVCDASNYYSLTLQLPNGDVPCDSILIPEGRNAGSINAEDKYVIQIPVAVGGHVTVNLVETGTSTMLVRATLNP